MRRALDAGADALVFEPELELTLAATVRAVASGQTVVPRKLRAGIEKPDLSHRERQVLTLVRNGLTNAEIAKRSVPRRKHHQEPPLLDLHEVRRSVAQGGRRALHRSGVGAPRDPGSRQRRSFRTSLQVSARTRLGSPAPGERERSGSIPFTRLDNADPELLAELLEVVARVSRNAAFTLGEEVEGFEREFAAYCGTEHAVGVSSGTAALELALRGLGIGPGDEVIVPTNSFIATAEAVSATGATPRLVDVDEGTALLTAEIVERAITARTRCVIPVHLYGRTVDMDPLLGPVPRARHLRRRGRLPGPWRTLSRPSGRLARRRRLLQLLPDQEPRRAGATAVRWSPTTPELADESAAAALARRGDPPSPRAGGGNGPPRRASGRDPSGQARSPRRVDATPSRGRRRAAGGSLRQPGDSSASAPGWMATMSSTSSSCDLLERDALRYHLDSEGIASAIHYPTPIHLQPAYADLGLGTGRACRSPSDSPSRAARCRSSPPSETGRWNGSPPRWPLSSRR